MSGSGEAKSNQYSYDEMSNKVIRNSHRPRQDDEKYNPSSLIGHISVSEMGSRVSKGSNSDREKKSSSLVKKSANSGEPKSIAQYTSAYENISYQPTNEETGHIFDLLMAEVRQVLPDSNHEVVLSASDAILEILKEKDSTVGEKKKQIIELIDYQISDVQLNELINLSNRIYDYDIGHVDLENTANDESPDEIVAVEFDMSDDDGEVEEDIPEEIENDHNNIINREEEENDSQALTNEVIIAESTKKEAEDYTLSIKDIDEYFLQRRISKLFDSADAAESSEKAKEVYKIMIDKDVSDRDLENEIMELMDYDHFDFVRLCIENRWKIVYRIQLLQAEDSDGENKLFEEMKKLGLSDLVAEFVEGTQKKRRLSEAEDPTKGKKIKSEKKTREPKIVDLDALSFDQGSRLMTNTSIKLPQGSYQQNKKSYNSIYIPPPNPPPQEEGEKLVSIEDLPQWARVAFPTTETTHLNRVQSKVFPEAFHSDRNLLLCAPTGAGKTNVAMLSVLRTINNYRNAETGKIDLKNFKIVYIAPLKALVQEQMREFQRRLTSNFNLVVNELTGDSSLSARQIHETQVIVTTPEKWDVVTRKNDVPYVKLVRLIIIDEIHLLHDERGPVLENILSRTLRQVEATAEPVRLIGLSATLPNYKDVAQFLRVDLQKGLFYFDASYRPCPLEQQFIGIKEKKAIKKLTAMNEACYDKLLECITKKHQLIIFVHSRKDTFKTAKWLKDKLEEDGKSWNTEVSTAEILKQEANGFKDLSLKEIVPGGIGIHHAGLIKGERSVVEDLFAQGHLQVLVSTATLAWGVNLPAHTVIIKGTETYSPERGTWIQLSPQDILQMLGRAGRPRYDKSGEGVIITSQDDIQYYLAILNQQLPIESQLMSRLPDSVNAEVVLGTIKSREDAVSWLGYTYLYIRMLQTPALYHVGADYGDDKILYERRVDLVHSALTILHESKLIIYDELSGSVKSTELGRISSHFYINYDTIKLYNTQLKSWFSEIEILKVFASSGEFKFIPSRQEEKLEVAKLMEKCPIPIKERPNEPLAKVNILLQTYISNLKLDGFALMADMTYISQNAGRLLRAMYEIALKKGWSSVSKTLLNFCKMVSRRMWTANSPFRQFGAFVSKDIVKATESSHLPWLSYFTLDAAELAEAINFKGNSGKAYQLLQKFPKLSLSYYCQPITSSLVRVQIEAIANWEWDYEIHGNSESFVVLVEDCDGEKILYADKLVINEKYAGREHLIDFVVPILEPDQPAYFVSLISEKWIQSEWKIPIVLSDLRFPKKFPSLTESIKLQNVPTTSLRNPQFIESFEFSYFNKFQSQIFPNLFGSNENIFIGISKGGGKTVCAELAILNHWNEAGGRIVYLTPNKSKIEKLARVWTKKYNNLEKSVSKLSGEVAKDVSVLGSNHLVLATPVQFYRLSNRWRQRKAVQAVDLIIADDLHTLGANRKGSMYEVVLARMRFISAQKQTNLRIVALSSSVANGRDIGEWLGCAKNNIFNFDPKERFNEIKEIELQASSVERKDLVVSSFLNQTYDFLKLDSEGKKIVFVPSRKHCIEIAIEFVQRASLDNLQLLKVEIEDLKPYLKRVTDETIKEMLSYGVGCYYEGMNATDKVIVEKMFENNVLSILLAAKETSSYAPAADGIVVLSTQEYDGKEHRYIDYSVNDILEMVGCCKNGLINQGNVLILTNECKLKFYSKFLNEPAPVESYVPTMVHDLFLSEISCKTFTSKQDCMDWFTFTYFYRRLQINPSFYDAKDTSQLGISEFLSEMIESTLSDLEGAKLIEFEEDEETIVPLNGAMIAAHYNVSFNSMKLFAGLDNRVKLKGILQAITSAEEFELIPVRYNEDSILSRIYNKVPYKVDDENYESPFFKAFILLQAHFSRIPLPVDLQIDQKIVLNTILNLLYACIDTLSSEGYLNAINAMDLSQMVVQAVWNNDSPLKQVPNFTNDILKRCATYKVETVYDIMSLEDDERDDVLRLEGDKLNRVAEFVNKYPNIDMTYELDVSEPIVANEPKLITIKLERDEELDDLDAITDFYPGTKAEGWWVVIGDAATKQLYAIKKTTIKQQSQQLQLEFTVPTAGHHELTLWCMCDSYVDADKEVGFSVDVEPED
ncbi:RNA helicase-related protein required for pre-mRNA splicing [Scheffersomyces stipitis CBS 6054]|uniref:RNA helicase-related protein required for pre-mRNA splicing n=1 Tax=Scheffersomyces stipitis (strain ATCC 58785 / CBS 6054 / NBRC 10063 / NRRL Y-11545) TaxID=322104 RepID=A3GEY0_PICST|nr:RNA helicase-related protein required for pre-mRNA splicing [Scheffersomyces stipitis CBS 6054]EAZ63248.2 RNA helicase-related protein required for pre-mRNA splicing [Scheffersomyces stipitis CBS 6054]